MQTLSIISAALILSISSVFGQAQGKLWDQDQISNVTVFLFQRLNDSVNISGSGTVLVRDSIFYLLTASHVAKDMRTDGKLVFRLPGDKPSISDLSSFLPNKSLNWKIHPVADLALVQLAPSTAELKKQLGAWSFPMSQIYFGKELPNRSFDLTFLGYPVLDLEMEHFSPLVFSCYLASGLITQLRYDTHTKCNMFFLNTPSIQGCSGSGVYASVKKEMYFGTQTTLLIGVVHGTGGDNTGGKLAAITPSYYIQDLLK